MTKIQRVLSPDPDQRVYFSHEELTAKIEMAERGDGEEHGTFMTALLEIPGISVVALRPYTAVIVKAPSFDWAEIEPSLLRLMTAFNAGEGALQGVPEPLGV